VTKDSEHLEFIYQRMKSVHGENELYDYMQRFRLIVDQIKELEYVLDDMRTNHDNIKRLLKVLGINIL
jgi:hemerythrin superfamily protein